jgi:hypothetical protein
MHDLRLQASDYEVTSGCTVVEGAKLNSDIDDVVDLIRQDRRVYDWPVAPSVLQRGQNDTRTQLRGHSELRDTFADYNAFGKRSMHSCCCPESR